MSEIASVVRALFRVFKDWAGENPLMAALLGLIWGVTVLVILRILLGLPNRPQLLDDVPEIVPTPVEAEQTPTPEATPIPPTPTPLPEIEVAFKAFVRVTSCELEDGCEVPVWENHTREVWYGAIPANATVDVVSCFYPTIRTDPEEIEGIALPVEESSSYTVEGLWCEIYYSPAEGTIIKGMLQYWYLETLVPEESLEGELGNG